MVGEDGVCVTHLPPGFYRLRIRRAIGHDSKEVDLEVSDQPALHEFQVGKATSVRLTVTDEAGSGIPCKVTFFGKADQDRKTPDPVLESIVKVDPLVIAVYSADGTILELIPPGSYDVLISREPEPHDVEFHEVDIQEGTQLELKSTLKRVVDTSGWVSA